MIRGWEWEDRRNRQSKLLGWAKKVKPFGGPWFGKVPPAHSDSTAWAGWEEAASSLGWQAPGLMVVRPSPFASEAEQAKAGQWELQMTVLRNGVTSLARTMVDESLRQPDPPGATVCSRLPPPGATAAGSEEPFGATKAVEGVTMEMPKPPPELPDSEGEGVVSLDTVKEVQIFIKSLQGKSRSISIDLNASVEMLKLRVQDKEGIPVVWQRLIFAGKQLEDTGEGEQPLLKDYNIRKGSTIFLVLSLKGGMRSSGSLDEWLWPDINMLDDLALFHETQVRALCLLHALNNMAQAPYWKESELQGIARNLSTLSGFQHSTESGWFSIEVLEIAVRKLGWTVSRLKAGESVADFLQVKGFIIHSRASQHWWTVRLAGGLSWAHDSMLPAPAPILDPVLLAGTLAASNDSLFVIQAHGAEFSVACEPLLGNQHWGSAVEFQTKRDEQLAVQVYRDELRIAREEHPPSFTGFSPMPSKDEGSTQPEVSLSAGFGLSGSGTVRQAVRALNASGSSSGGGQAAGSNVACPVCHAVYAEASCPDGCMGCGHVFGNKRSLGKGTGPKGKSKGSSIRSAGDQIRRTVDRGTAHGSKDTTVARGVRKPNGKHVIEAKGGKKQASADVEIKGQALGDERGSCSHAACPLFGQRCVDADSGSRCRVESFYMGTPRDTSAGPQSGEGAPTPIPMEALMPASPGAEAGEVADSVPEVSLVKDPVMKAEVGGTLKAEGGTELKDRRFEDFMNAEALAHAAAIEVMKKLGVGGKAFNPRSQMKMAADVEGCLKHHGYDCCASDPWPMLGLAPAEDDKVDDVKIWCRVRTAKLICEVSLDESWSKEERDKVNRWKIGFNTAGLQAALDLASMVKIRRRNNPVGAYGELGSTALDMIIDGHLAERCWVGTQISSTLGSLDQFSGAAGTFLTFPSAAQIKDWVSRACQSGDAFKAFNDGCVVIWAPTDQAALGRLLANFKAFLKETGSSLKLKLVIACPAWHGCADLNTLRDLAPPAYREELGRPD